MKKQLAIMGLALALGVPAIAQEQKNDATTTTTQEDRNGKRGRRGDKMQRMAQELNLTDAQKTQLRSMHEQNREQMKSIKNDQSLTQEQKKEKFKALHDSRQSQMNSILTPDQQQKFAQIKENRKGKMGKRGKHGRHGKRRQQQESTGTGF